MTRASLSWRVALVATALFAVLAGAFFAAYGNVNQDEGWYLYASGLLYGGKLPYRDFAFFQMPLLPLVYGAPQALLGHGLAVGRATSLVFLLGTLALATRLAFERGGPLAAFVALALLALTPLSLWTLTSTRTEPMNAFLWMLCLFLLLRHGAGVRASAGAWVAAVLATATRLSSLPATGLVLLFVIARHRHAPRALATALAPGLAVAAAVAALVLAPGFDDAFFNLVTSQTTRHDQIRDLDPWGPTEFVMTRLNGLGRIVVGYGIGPVIALAAGLAAALQWLRGGRDAAGRAAAAGTLAVLGAVVYLPNLVPRYVYPHYFAPAFPAFAVLLGLVLAWGRERATGTLRHALHAVLVLLLAMQAGAFLRQLGSNASIRSPQLREVHEAGREIARLVPEDRLLLTLDTYLAVESGRELVPGFEMGFFSWSPGWDEEVARRFRVATPALFASAVRSPAVGGVALSDQALGLIVDRRFGGHLPDRQLPESELRRLLPGLRYHRLRHVEPDFGQFDDTLYLFSSIRP